MSAKHLSEDEVTSLPKSLIEVGIPIQFPIYDIKGQLLMQKGTVVTTEEQLERLIERGLYLNKKTIDQLPSSQPIKGNNEAKQAEESEPKEKLVDFKLDDIKLGETLYLSPLIDETNSTKYTVKFLGGLKKSSIICSAPMLDNKLIYVKEDSGFLIRIFDGKEMYNFTSIITACHNKPFPHIHLKFPAGVYKKAIRKHDFVQASIICSIINQTSDALKNTKLSGRIIEVSLDSAQIESNTDIGEVNDEIECRFKLEILKKEIFFSVLCVIRKLKGPSESEKSQKYKYDLQFKTISFEEKVMLQNYIYQSLTK